MRVDSPGDDGREPRAPLLFPPSLQPKEFCILPVAPASDIPYRLAVFPLPTLFLIVEGVRPTPIERYTVRDP